MSRQKRTLALYKLHDIKEALPADKKFLADHLKDMYVDLSIKNDELEAELRNARQAS